MRALDEAEAEYRRLVLDAPADRLKVSAEVNRLIAIAVSTDPKWFWHGADR